MPAAVLTAQDVSVAYGDLVAVADVSVQVTRGSIIGVLGPNGAGKTTTLRAISGMVRITGDVRFCGQPLAGRAIEDIVRLGIAHVPQGRGTFVRQTVEENLEIGAMSRRDRAGIPADIDRAYGYFPRLKERRRQQAGTLSGGEQQMLAVARALMLRPKLMLLDEPSFGLAPLIVRELFAILRTLNEAEKVSMLVVEQNASLALDLADRAILIETGRLVTAGAADDLRKDENVRRAYLGY
jgi:branched-chain amino acid transport system ATP-binding protein